MNCNETRRLWDLYVDSEGDSQMHFRINDHLSHCADCRRWMEGQTKLEHSIRETLASDHPGDHQADWSLIIERSMGDSDVQRIRRFNVRWTHAALIAGSILLLVTWFNSDRSSATSDPAPLIRESVSVHQHIASGGLRPEFESQSDLAVDQYLVRRVSFPVRCPPRKDSGFLVRGAGLCEIEGDSVAYVFGTVEDEPVSIFVLPAKAIKGVFNGLMGSDSQRLPPRTPQVTEVAEYQVAFSLIDQNLVIVTGRCRPSALVRVLQSYGTYPHG